MMQKLPNFNMEYHMLYVHRIKSLRDRKEKILFICQVLGKTLGELCFFVVAKSCLSSFIKKNTRQIRKFPSVFILPNVFSATLGKKVVSVRD
jgi:hypothetical protein